MKTKALILLFPVLLVSCNTQRQNFDRGIIPPVPVNFTDVNSSYDDYNSDFRITWTTKSFSLIFSTNRNSFGSDFDLIGYRGNIISDLVDGSFEMNAGRVTFNLLEAVNTSGNELGPYFTADYEYEHQSFPLDETVINRFFYSSDIAGMNDIYFCQYTLDKDYDFLSAGDPVPITALNTDYNEGYLTIHHNEVAGRETVYFTSDRDGTYDIWRAVSEVGKLINESPGLTFGKVGQLSGNTQDKCPYVAGDIMAFASDRAGGYGGFDLWYSVWNGQGWSVPVNFGNTINTGYDEYRPVIIPTEESEFLNDLMIFSSNRPGGKGGFDLYYVGINRQ